MSTKVIPSPLPGFDLETDLASEKGCNKVTLARARKLGLIEYIEWCGRIFDNRDSVDDFIRAKVKRRNPPRTARRRSSLASTITA
jgi:hypothetical protein